MADRFIWYELMTTDLDAALDFYTRVVGWTAADHENGTPGGMRYVVLSAGGRGVGGVMQLTEEMRAGAARPGWVGYVGVSR
jgi:predicted enzyme related to lactoylglutathione lyase